MIGLIYANNSGIHAYPNIANLDGGLMVWKAKDCHSAVVRRLADIAITQKRNQMEETTLPLVSVEI